MYDLYVLYHGYCTYYVTVTEIKRMSAIISPGNRTSSERNITSRKTLQKRNERLLKIYRYLYHNIHGIDISLKYRKDNKVYHDKSLVYGEIIPQSFLSILSITIQSPSSSSSSSYRRRTFVDLGSGTGEKEIIIINFIISDILSNITYLVTNCQQHEMIKIHTYITSDIDMIFIYLN